MDANRRRFIATLGGAAAGIPLLTTPALAQSSAEGLTPDLDTDQTGPLQAAVDLAARTSGRLDLPAGRFNCRTLRLPSGFTLASAPGATQLVQTGTDALLLIEDADGVLVTGLTLDGGNGSGERWHGGLAHIANSTNVTLRDCAVANTQLNGITVMESAATVENCTVTSSAYTGIFVYNGKGVRLSGNRISACGNGGIRVWRGESGPDGTIVTGNHIADIDWTDGGNGQNGNGINIFRADGVIVSDNFITDCAFSAIRLNGTNNTIIKGNNCFNSSEVALFSEFEFSGSVISGNIIDTACAGISMTNYDHGGRLASCTGNIVRNLTGPSDVNPDLQVPYGIAAQADAVVANNVVEAVRGIGIAAGWGPYLRDVTVTGNLIRDVDTGIVVSVAPDAGAAVITGNSISGATGDAMAARAWNEVISSNLVSEADRFETLTVSGNVIS